MRNRMYGGVRGRKTKVGRKLLRFPPTRFHAIHLARFSWNYVLKTLFLQNIIFTAMKFVRIIINMYLYGVKLKILISLYSKLQIQNSVYGYA